MHFQVKNILKSNHYHIHKHPRKQERNINRDLVLNLNITSAKH